MNNLKVGADPEMFLRQQGSLVSAFGLIPGTKEQPYPVELGAVQVDGMAVEFNIDPANSPDEFVFNIRSVMSQLQQMLPTSELLAEPVAEFGAEFIKQQPAEAKVLGCDPDFNAWTGEENTPPNADAPFRTAAGHVHIGFTEGADLNSEQHRLMCEGLIKQLDFYLALPSLVFDDSTKRRELYGKAGAYRLKSYGCEYRVLSNRWLSDDALISWVFRATEAAVNNMSNPLVEKYGDIQEIINNSEVDKALEIINAESLEVPYVP